MNNTSSVLGSALHVACADNVANRADIVRLLLESGADPNIEALSDNGLMLPGVLCEYITSNGHKEVLDKDVVDLLLFHGAKVILKTQHRHPLGIYSVLPILAKHPKVFHRVLQAAEGFDPFMLRRLTNIPEDVKKAIVDVASEPLSLRQISRFSLRRSMQTNLHLKVPQLEIPRSLHSYLLFEIS